MSATSCPRDRHILFLSISTITLGLLQILLSLTVISTFQILQKHSTSWPPPHWHPSPATIVRPLNLVPQNLATEQTRVIIACGVLSVGAGIVGCVSSRSGERNSRSTLVVLSNGLVAVTLLASFIYMLLQEDILSFRFRYTDFYSTGQRFTHESWVCQLKDLYTEDEVVNWSMICLEAVSVIPRLMARCERFKLTEI